VQAESKNHHGFSSGQFHYGTRGERGYGICDTEAYHHVTDITNSPSAGNERLQ